MSKKNPKKKIVIGILLIVFGYTLIIPAIIGVCMIFKARKELKEMRPSSQNTMQTTNASNAGRNDSQKRKRILNVAHPGKYLRSEDHAIFDGSSCCPLCSLYKSRVFSISGKDKRFPPLVTLPDEIHDGKCDVCQCYYSILTWFEGVSTPDVATAIRKSNAPLVDQRTPEQIQNFTEQQTKLARRLAKLEANSTVSNLQSTSDNRVAPAPKNKLQSTNITPVKVQPYSGAIGYGKSWTHPDIAPLLWFADGAMRNIDVKKEALISSYTDDFCTVKIYGAEEPSALHSKLQIAKTNRDIPHPPYYPSYRVLTPEQRYKYLEFLATPYENHDIGYVFLFYYGLERHLLLGDFDRAFDVILKLRDVYENASFQKYSANALAMSCIIKNRLDRFIAFIQSMDKSHEVVIYPNLYVLIRHITKQPLLASDLMRLSSSFDFTNRRYIKAYPEMFEAFLNEAMLEATGTKGLQIPPSTPSSKKLLIFANISLTQETVRIPDFFSNSQFFGEGRNLLQIAHEKCKAALAKQRKATREKEKQEAN